MKLTFKRKYTSLFIIFLVLIAIAISFYLVGPKYINRETQFFNQILIISLIDSLLITLFIFGLYRVNYYFYYDHLEIRRSLRKNRILQYSNIIKIVEHPNDKLFFIFGKQPSFKIKYQLNGKQKSYRIRVVEHKLCKLVLENEMKIHIPENKK